jgi:hypothetical protein
MFAADGASQRAADRAQSSAMGALFQVAVPGQHTEHKMHAPRRTAVNTAAARKCVPVLHTTPSVTFALESVGVEFYTASHMINAGSL